MKAAWPEFMTPDPDSMKYWKDMRKLFPDYQLCLCDGDLLVGYGNSLPLAWSGSPETLPSSWTETLAQGVKRNESEAANTLAAVNIAIHPDYRQRGINRS